MSRIETFFLFQLHLNIFFIFLVLPLEPILFTNLTQEKSSLQNFVLYKKVKFHAPEPYFIDINFF